MKGSVNVDKTKNESNKRKFDGSHKNVENTVIGKSFVSVVKTSRMPIDKESPPAIVLKDNCLNAKDLTLSLAFGRTLGINSNSTAKAKDSFRGNVGVGLLGFRSLTNTLNSEFVPDVRLVWVELDGVPFKILVGSYFQRFLRGLEMRVNTQSGGDDDDEFKWARNADVTLKPITYLSEEEEEDELSVEDNNDGRINDLEANNGIDESDMEEVTEEDHSLSHPLGFTPEKGLNEGNTVNLDMKDYGENERDDNSFVNLEDGKDNSES
ncbi:hypothetical protein Tco_0388710, partial [Tanacetum coccineum]